MRRTITAAVAAALALVALSGCTSGSGSPRAAGSTSSARTPASTASDTAASDTAASDAAASDAAVSPTTPAISGVGFGSGGAAASAPASPAALIAYVRAGRAVATADYQAGASASGQPMQPTPGIDEFTTPSGNISCGILLTAGADVMCSAAHYTYSTPPRPANCHLNYAAGWVSLGPAGVTRSLCLGGPPFPPVSRTLPYGATITAGPIACRIEASFLACADTASGHGFVVSRDELRTY